VFFFFFDAVVPLFFSLLFFLHLLKVGQVQSPVCFFSSESPILSHEVLASFPGGLPFPMERFPPLTGVPLSRVRSF